MSSKKRCATPPGRIRFAAIAETKDSLKGDPRYSIEMMFPKDTDMGPLKEFIKETATSGKNGWPKGIPKNWASPILDGDEIMRADGSANEQTQDHWVIRPWRRPDFGRVKCYVGDEELQYARVDEVEGTIIDKEMVDEYFYSGAWARASVDCWNYTNGTNKGSQFGLVALKFVKHDDKLWTPEDYSEDFSEDEEALI